MTVFNPKGSNKGVEMQATRYLYASSVNASWQTGVVYSDSTDSLSQDADGVWTFDVNGDHGDHTSKTVDWLGRTVTSTDQRGVVHAYTYDSAGCIGPAGFENPSGGETNPKE